MIRVILESPFAGNRERNRRYLNAAIRHCVLVCGETPYASHRMLTDALDDGLETEREAGIQAGFAWRPFAQKTVVYIDLGISRGMALGIEHAKEIGQEVVYRKLGLNWEAERGNLGPSLPDGAEGD
jgi:hypothetical protein